MVKKMSSMYEDPHTVFPEVEDTKPIITVTPLRKRLISIIDAFSTGAKAVKKYYDGRHVRSANRIYNRALRKLSR